jgi:hypothetical protein
MNRIHCDCDQYIAVLYDDGYSGTIPTGMIGPTDDVKALASDATSWVTDGLEWDAKRRAVIAYMDNGPSMHADVTIAGAQRVEPPNA